MIHDMKDLRKCKIFPIHFGKFVEQSQNKILGIIRVRVTVQDSISIIDVHLVRQ